MTKITEEDVRKVARLARLQLVDSEIETYTRQIEKILDYVDHLQKVNTKDIPPTTRAVEVVNKTREDNVQVSSSRDREELLELAPQREADFFRVPKIISES